MGISVENLEEGCCKALEDYKILVTDKNRKDKNIKFVDYVLDLEDKYLFIEKSPFIYLYCKSGLREVDRILVTSLNMKNRKNTFLSCDRLDAFISKIKES